jgi:histidinol-phosphatase
MMAAAAKIAFLDRDGTLIIEPADEQVDRLDKIALVPGVIPALLRLREAGYEFAMVTNQDGLGTASFPEADFRRVQDFVLGLFRSQGIDFAHVFVCPHKPADGCSCRKPDPGILGEAARSLNFDRERSFVAGDRETDLEFARNIGVPAIAWIPPMPLAGRTSCTRFSTSHGPRPCGAKPARRASRSASTWMPSNRSPYTPASAFSITCLSRSRGMAALR